MGLVRRLDGPERSLHAEQGQWTYRVPLSCARSPPRDGSEDARNARAISRADRRPAAGKRRRSRLISSTILIASIGQLHDCLLRGGSAERERKGFHVRIEKFDLKLSIGDGLWLPDQLVQP